MHSVRVIPALRRTSLRLVEVYCLGSRGLFQSELVIGERFVNLQLQDGKRDVVLLSRTIDLDLCRKVYSAVIFIAFIPSVCSNISILVVDQLAVRQQIVPAEDDFAGEEPAASPFSNNFNLIVWLLELVPFGVSDGFITAFHDRDLTLRIDFAQQQSIVNMLRAQVFQRLLWIPSLNIVATNYESVLGRDPKFEDVPIADHVEGPVANNWHETNHSQHCWLTY